MELWVSEFNVQSEIADFVLRENNNIFRPLLYHNDYIMLSTWDTLQDPLG